MCEPYKYGKPEMCCRISVNSSCEPEVESQYLQEKKDERSVRENPARCDDSGRE